MLLSVILITWNGRELLAECLKSMSFLMARADVEIFVFDNGSEDGTVDFLRNRYPAVKVIPLGSNYGVAYARNRALERACGRYLWILDNDTEINPDVFYGMLHYMEEHPDVGLAGCRLIDADGLVQESCKRYPGIGEKIRNLLLKKGYRYAYGLKRMKENFEPEYVIGACQFIRREAYEAAGPLDEKIFYGPEDADFCIRIHSAGYRIMYLSPSFRKSVCDVDHTFKILRPPRFNYRFQHSTQQTMMFSESLYQVIRTCHLLLHRSLRRAIVYICCNVRDSPSPLWPSRPDYGRIRALSYCTTRL